MFRAEIDNAIIVAPRHHEIKSRRSVRLRTVGAQCLGPFKEQRAREPVRLLDLDKVRSVLTPVADDAGGAALSRRPAKGTLDLRRRVIFGAPHQRIAIIARNFMPRASGHIHRRRVAIIRGRWRRGRTARRQ